MGWVKVEEEEEDEKLLVIDEGIFEKKVQTSNHWLQSFIFLMIKSFNRSLSLIIS